MKHHSGRFQWNKVLFGLSLCSFLSAQAEVKVFILSGQSNMVGSGKIAGISPNYLNGVTNVSYYVATNDLPGSTALFKYTSPLRPGNACEPTFCELKKCYSESNFGPEVGIAKKLSVAYPTDKIIIIKSAWGGTGLEKHWLNPAEPVYPWFFQRTKAALDDVKKRHGAYSLKGLIWLQGETDAATQLSAERYRLNFTAFIGKVRTDFSSPGMPFLYGTIQNAVKTDGTRTWPFGNIVVHAQRTLRNVVGLGCTSKTSGKKASVYPLQLVDDCNLSANFCKDGCLGFNKYHFDAAGLLYVGESLGQMAIDFFKKGANTLKCTDYTPITQ